MRKVAVFVEGMVEQVFIKDILLKCFDYSNIRIECTKINSSEIEEKSCVRNYDLCSEYEFFFLIVWVGNDASVISEMNKRYDNMLASEFNIIICLQDMKFDRYNELNGGKNYNIETINKMLRITDKCNSLKTFLLSLFSATNMLC